MIEGLVVFVALIVGETLFKVAFEQRRRDRRHRPRLTRLLDQRLPPPLLEERWPHGAQRHEPRGRNCQTCGCSIQLCRARRFGTCFGA